MVLIKRASAFRVISASERWGSKRLAPLALVVLSLLHPHVVLADDVLPQGGTVVNGNVAITTPGAGHMVLNQSSDRAIVNWDGFSIGQGNTVDINQPGTSSAILNRVTGSATSEIHGRLNATGEVFVVNPNGLLIGKNGEVNAGGGFVGSTLDTTDEDFMARRLRFDGVGSSAAVSNEGRVVIGRGGFAALLGGRVSNSGLVMVPMGRIGLGAGERATLDVSGDRFLQIEVPSEGDTDEMRALIENSGTLSSDGGLIEMRAATAREAARYAINLSGVADASSVTVRGGTIVLGGGSGGRVTVSGRATTRQRAAIVVDQSVRPMARRGGGDIIITGRDISLESAELDASWTGGTVRVGGDYQGGGSLPRALYLGVDSETIINADAGENGDGGRVILWSDVHTDFAGSISARGGTQSGDGGFVEVSGKQTLAFNGLVDTSATNGAFGTLLLDPVNITIDVGPTTGGVLNPTDFSPNTEDSTLSVTALETNLASNNVTVSTGGSGSPGLQNGDITVDSLINWTASTTLSFEAHGDVFLNAGIDASNGGFDVSAGGTITTALAGTINVGRFDLSLGSWVQEGTLPTFAAGDFRLNTSAGVSFLRAESGIGSESNPYVLNDIYGVQALGTVGAGDQHFALGQDIDASVTDGWNGSVLGGFRAIESNAGGAFTGSLDGGNHTISDLKSNGLFASTNGASIRNLVLTDVDVERAGDVASIVNSATNTTIDNVAVTGDVSSNGGFTNIAGLVADFSGEDGRLTNSSFNGDVRTLNTSGSDLNQGGLVGRNDLSEISDSSFNGNVADDGAYTGNRNVGGAVGLNQGLVSGVTAMGTLNSSSNGTDDSVNTIGGLVGSNTAGGTINGSQSDVAISVLPRSGIFAGLTGVTGTLYVGGLVGSNSGDVSTVNSSGNVVVTNEVLIERLNSFTKVGGMFGFNSGSVDNAQATGDVSVTTALMQAVVGGFVGDAEFSGSEGNSISAAIATGDVSLTTDTSGNLGGFAGENDMTITDAIASGDVTLNPTGGTVFAGVGGFIGNSVTSDSVVQRTAARGDVLVMTGSNEIYVGGHTGLMQDGTLQDGYATGNVSASSSSLQHVAGLVGFAQDGSITNTFANGLVSATGPGVAFEGGLIGTNSMNNTSVVASFWDMTASGQADTMGAGLGVGLTTEQFENTDEFFDLTSAAGWNYSSVWAPGASGQAPSIITIDRVVFARPDTLELTYGDSTDTTTATGPIVGGPGSYVFSQMGETLDTTSVFQSLNFPDVNAGTRSFTVDTAPLTSSEGAEYTVVALSGIAEIDRAALELTLNNTNKTYGTALSFDGTEFTITDGQLFFGDEVDTITITSAGADADADVIAEEGSYAITGSAPVSGTGTDNYDISFENGSLTVDQAALEVTIDNATKTYGSALSFDGTEFTVTGGLLFFDDEIETVSISSAGAQADADVVAGGYAIIGAEPAAGTGAGNYEISFQNGTLTVDQAALEVTIDNASKTYGSALSFDGTEFTVTGGLLFFGDEIETVSISSAGAQADADVVAGGYAIIGAEPAAGTGTDNYDISFQNGTLTVDQAMLELTLDSTTKTYGSTVSFDGSEFTVTGGQLLFGDAIGPISITSEGASSNAEVIGDGGGYTISGAQPTAGTGTDNYDISLEDGTLTVDRALLELTANDANKIQGTELLFDGTEFSITGGELFFDDRVDTISIASAGAAADAQFQTEEEGSGDGTFAIVGSEPITGNRTDNYDISFEPGTLTLVTPPVVPPTLPPVGPNTNPTDNINLVIDDGGTFVSSTGGVGGGTTLSKARETLGFVQELTTRLEISGSRCNESSGNVNRYLACLSDSLDEFADELDIISTDLPPGMEGVATIVRDARRNVDRARTRAESRLATATTDAQRSQIQQDAVNEARSALDNAASEIRKSISFVRADDPELASVQRATITAIASAVDTVGIQLSRANEL